MKKMMDFREELMATEECFMNLLDDWEHLPVSVHAESDRDNAIAIANKMHDALYCLFRVNLEVDNYIIRNEIPFKEES